MKYVLAISILLIFSACSYESEDSDLVVVNSAKTELLSVDNFTMLEDTTHSLDIEVTAEEQFICNQALIIKNISNPTLFKETGISAIGVNGNCKLNVTPELDQYGESEIEWSLSINGEELNSITTSISVTAVKDLNSISTANFNNSEHTHSCKVSNNTAYCWGGGTSGQLGNGTWDDSREKVEVTGLGGVSQSVTTNFRNSCALKTDSTVWCWGSGTYGQLGDGTTVVKNTPAQVIKSDDGLALTNIIKVDHGYLGVCALDSSGQVWCWGYNGLGAVGDGTNIQRNSAVKVLRQNGGGTIDLSDVKDISAGGYHRCAVRTNGSAWCWGRGSFGSLGDDLSANSNIAVEVLNYNSGSPIGFTNADKIDVGLYHSCLVGSDKSVWCWGAGTSGKLGDGFASNRSTARRVIKDDDSNLEALDISLGFNHTCAIANDSSLYCWGAGRYGQLGTGDYKESSTKARSVMASDGTTPLEEVTMVSTGFASTCLVSRDQMYCFGSNSRGALGSLDVKIDTLVPTEASIDGEILEFTQGGSYSNPGFHCALMNDVDKTMKCWGVNYSGQLGRGNFTISNTAQNVLDEAGSSTLKNITSASNSDSHACAVSSGQVYCWGKNEYYQLGLGIYSVSEPLPKKVIKFDNSEFNDAVSVTVGPFHSCAIDTTNQIWCWGSNSSGFLGNNTTTTSSRAVRVLKDNLGGGSTNFSDGFKVIAGDRHTCAIDTSNQVWCWGLNASGQLGDNSTTNRLIAIRSYKNDGGSTLFNNAKEINIGSSTTCIIDQGDKLWCYGSGIYYQTSQGTSSNVLIGEEVILFDNSNPVGVTKISGSFSSGCFLNSSNELFCGGRNLLGSIPYPSRQGYAETKYTQIKDPVDNSLNWSGLKDISITAGSGCVLTTTDSLYCWGLNTMGQNAGLELSSTSLLEVVNN